MNIRLREYLQKPFILFLVAWGVLNLIQAGLTPINNDEAYYWMYSKYLSWGYFDHPPMIALMIRIGYSFFHNELGVRFVTVLSQLAALSLIWSLINKEHNEKKEYVLLFFTLVVILPVCNIFGVIATPDAPLILFSAVFLLAYKRFLENENWKNTLFLGLSVAALLYSKYHSGLLIILVILSNLRLFKNIRFYSALFLALLLVFPHLFWQYSNEFPSLKYHLVDRVSGFNPDHVPEYLGSQLLFHNPLILPILIWIMIKVRSKNLFDRALYFIIIGFFAFFLISSFRYRVQPQWTALIVVPMILILINNAEYRPWIKKYVKWISFIVFPLFLFARFTVAFDFLPVSYLKTAFHNKKQWAKDIGALAGDRPVVFTNSYQRPSVYTFYTGKFAHSLNNLNYRKTQYDIWDFEEKVHGSEVLYVPHFLTDYYREHLSKHELSTGDTVWVRGYKDFQSLQRECVVLKTTEYIFTRTGMNSIHFKIFNPYPFTIDLKHKELPVVFQIAFFKNGNMQVKKNLNLPENILKLNAGDTISVECKFSLEDLPSGKFKFAICSESGILYDTYNSEIMEVTVNE
jgi:hypothetical protein